MLQNTPFEHGGIAVSSPQQKHFKTCNAEVDFVQYWIEGVLKFFL